MLQLSQISDPRFVEYEELLREHEKAFEHVPMNEDEEGELVLDPAYIEEVKKEKVAMMANLKAKNQSTEDTQPDKKEAKLFFTHTSTESHSDPSTPLKLSIPVDNSKQSTSESN